MVMQDLQLDDILARYPKLIVKRTEAEYRVFRPAEENKGSLWIARQKHGYRVVTTGQAHSVDRDLERLTGSRAGEMSDRAHKWWKDLDNNNLEDLFRIFSSQ
jgi:hypothetical protein